MRNMVMQWGGFQYRLEYDQKMPGYAGDLPEHWGLRVEEYTTEGEVKAAVDRLNAYVAQMAERYPGQLWVRNVRPIMRRDVGYSDWATVQL